MKAENLMLCSYVVAIVALLTGAFLFNVVAGLLALSAISFAVAATAKSIADERKGRKQ